MNRRTLTCLGIAFLLGVVLVGFVLVGSLIIASPSAPATRPTTALISQVPTLTGENDTGLPGWLQIYFTNPNPPDQTNNGIDRFVVPVLEAAQNTIDLASFDFNLPSVVNAVTSAAKRGVKVRVVVDEVNGTQVLQASEAEGGKDVDMLKQLASAKIQVVDGGRSNGLMHDKIIIVDGKTLFMGSWNMSYNDTFRNNNNLLVITDPQLIANYQAKFNELYVDKKFGAQSKVKALQPQLTLDGVQVENYFSPRDEVMNKLINYVAGAKKSIQFMAFTYTDKDLANAMIAREKAGVKVEGVIENRGAKNGALVPLFCAKLPVLTDGNKYTMHHKVIIIDGSTVITGSFNFTKSADDANDDNVLVIHSPAVAALYSQEYSRVSAIASSPAAADITCTK